MTRSGERAGKRMLLAVRAGGLEAGTRVVVLRPVGDGQVLALVEGEGKKVLLPRNVLSEVVNGDEAQTEEG